MKTKHAARILADSISPDGARLTTMEVVFPRIVLAEFNTHRQLSKNSASSRAIPVKKMLSMVWNDPYVPSHLGKNQAGMSADTELRGWRRRAAVLLWHSARLGALGIVWLLVKVNLHKQIANRLLECFMWHTVICTASEWSNFFHLRCHPAAHPDIRLVAEAMQDALDLGIPVSVGYCEWHLPLIFNEDWNEYTDLPREAAYGILCKVSIGRCARVSYLTHDGVRDHAKDIELFERLFDGGHMSPFEHVATPLPRMGWEELDGKKEHFVKLDDRVAGLASSRPEETFIGNFKGWVQFRKLIPHESDLMGAPR